MQQPQNGEARPTGRIRNADFHRRKTKKKRNQQEKTGQPQPPQQMHNKMRI